MAERRVGFGFLAINHNRAASALTSALASAFASAFASALASAFAFASASALGGFLERVGEQTRQVAFVTWRSSRFFRPARLIVVRTVSLATACHLVY
jgi:hypothetical protein